MEFAWQPHAGAQTDFCSRGEFEALYGGQAGPGKTDCLVVEALRFIDHPRYQGLLLRRTFPQLQEIIDRCYEYYPYVGGIYRSTEHRWYFPSGSKIVLGHMQHESDKYNYQGKQYQYIGFDELTQFTETQYLYLFSRARKGKSEVPIRIRGATNPGGVGHQWVKNRFIDVAKPGETYIDPTTGLSRIFIPGKLTDNPTLLQKDPDYINRLLAMPEIERKRLLEGIWDIFEGQAFPELSMRIHGCEPFPIPPEWEKFVSLDWGYSRPFSVGWWAVDFDGILYRYREWYGCKEGEPNSGLRLTAVEVARGILEREKEKIRYRVADPACWNQQIRKDKTLGPSVIDDMAKEGLQFVKADNNRLLGKLQVHERLKVIEETDKDGVVVQERPQVVIFNNCKHFWRTMQLLRMDPKNVEDVETDHQEDHCLHGETKIFTPMGWIRIKDLVGSQGLIFTGTNWRRYERCWKTRRNAEILILELSNGTVIRCTPDHRFMTENGWVEAQNLSSSARLVRSFWANDTGFAENISNVKGNAFTGRFMNIISEKFRKGGMCTISMETYQKTFPPISVRVPAEGIYPTMPGAWITPIGSRPCMKALESGIEVPKALLGIENNTKKNALRLSVRRLRSSGRSDVYCLSVPEENCFVIESGILSHNCYDETRYAFMSRPIVPKHKVTGPPPGSFAAERARLIRAKKYAQRHGISLAAAYQKIR